MPARKAKGSCYVYRLFDGHETVYIGKGSGRRLALQRAVAIKGIRGKRLTYETASY